MANVTPNQRHVGDVVFFMGGPEMADHALNLSPGAW